MHGGKEVTQKTKVEVEGGRIISKWRSYRNNVWTSELDWDGSGYVKMSSKVINELTRLLIHDEGKMKRDDWKCLWIYFLIFTPALFLNFSQMLKAKSVIASVWGPLLTWHRCVLILRRRRKKSVKYNYGGMDKHDFCCGEMSGKHSFCLAGQLEQPMSLFYVMYQFSPWFIWGGGMKNR
jgi:hypothetical protein